MGPVLFPVRPSANWKMGFAKSFSPYISKVTLLEWRENKAKFHAFSDSTQVAPKGVGLPSTLHTRFWLFIYKIGQGSACQISRAYSVMVRSLENFPEEAMFRTALRDQFSLSAYNSANRACAWP